VPRQFPTLESLCEVVWMGSGIVLAGEDVYDIAVKMGVPPSVLRDLNGVDGNTLQVGSVLRVPPLRQRQPTPGFSR